MDRLEQYLHIERDSIIEQIEVAKQKLAKIDALLGEESGIEFDGSVTTVRCEDPSMFRVRWQLIATTTMGRCREVLQRFGREVTAQEIRDRICWESKTVPAKTITEMLYKASRKEKSGIYRIDQEHGPAKYGLIAWQIGERGPDGYRDPELDDSSIPMY